MNRRLRRVATPIVVAVVALVFWDTAWLYPLRLFVVFLHELSHGLAAVLTGGTMHTIGLSPDEGGVCMTSGGSRFLVLNAGYLGSLLFGALFLVLAARGRGQQATVAAVGIVTLLVTLLYVRTPFGFVYGLATGAILLLVARKTSRETCADVLTVVGVVSCLYAVWDVGSDVLSRRVAGSDAEALGRLTGIPGPVYGVLWVGISLAIVVWALRVIARGKR